MTVGIPLSGLSSYVFTCNFFWINATGTVVPNNHWATNKTHHAHSTGAGWARVNKPQPVPIPICTRSVYLHGFTNLCHSLALTPPTCGHAHFFFDDCLFFSDQCIPAHHMVLFRFVRLLLPVTHKISHLGPQHIPPHRISNFFWFFFPT